MVCQFLLYNKVNQLYIYYIPISPPSCGTPTLPIPPVQVITKHQADIPVLWGCFPLAIYFTFGSIYMSMPLSHFVPAYSSPSPCLQVHSLHLHLYSCPATRFISTIILRFHIWVSAYGICFSLSDLLHSVGQTLVSPNSLQITQFRSFLWLSNILLYICATSSLSIHLLMDIQVASNSQLL